MESVQYADMRIRVGSPVSIKKINSKKVRCKLGMLAYAHDCSIYKVERGMSIAQSSGLVWAT